MRSPAFVHFPPFSGADQRSTRCASHETSISQSPPHAAAAEQTHAAISIFVFIFI
jgi:hypothetical protein